MKKLLILFLIAFSLQTFSQPIPLPEAPKIDKRVELLSIVFRLAGNQEYNAPYFKLYNEKVESHFNAFKEHELIQFARELKAQKGISYDAVVSMAVVLDEQLHPMVDFSTTLPGKRWNKEDAVKFVRLLKQFYKDAGCEAFFRENEALFAEVKGRFGSVDKVLDLNWFQTFYGNKSDENFKIILSIGTGGQNYGPSYTLPNAPKKVFAILGTWRVDESGMPVYNQAEYLPFILHEFAHSFVNPMHAKQPEAFEASGKSIYKAVEYEMSRQQAYGEWQIMLNEALVRASVIKYFIDHGAGEQEVQQMLINENNNGFIWIKGLVEELKKYDAQRSTYPTLESYLPVLVTAYQSFAAKITQYDAQRPRVESITEFSNNDTQVSSELKSITINFDKPLSGKGFSVNLGNKGKAAFPKLDNISYTNENKSVVMQVQLEPEHEYQLVLTGKNFKSPEGFALKTYEVNFKTK